MKKQITGFIAALVLFVMYSYKTTNGDIVHETSSRARYNISIPLAQKNIIVTSNHDYVKKLIVKGYVCEDVDIVFFGAYSKSTNKKY